MKDHCRDCPVVKTGLFATLRRSSKSAVSCMMVHGRYKRRQILYQEGNPSSRVYAVKSGMVKIYKSQTYGKDQIIDVMGPGAVFNLESLSLGRCSVSAEVLAESELCFVERERLARLLGDNRDLAMEVIRILSQSLAASHDRMLEFGTQSAKARLASFFIRLFPLVTDGEALTTEIRLPISRREIGDLIGVSLETVSRLFRLLSREGIASANHRQVTILSLPRLRKMVERANL
ncbi:MAG: Crp/Fnr family transcriptional regulator [Elusimicrobiota bacterium]